MSPYSKAALTGGKVAFGKACFSFFELILEIGVLRRSNFDYSCFLVGFFFLSFFWGVVVSIGTPPSLRD